MSPNRTSVWNVLTIRFSRELPLFNFERLIYYAPESNLWVKSDDHLNFSRASVVQLWASRYIMTPNRTSVWKLMTIWIYRDLLLFNFKHLDKLSPRIEHPNEMLWPFQFLESFRCSISSVSISDMPESDIRVRSYDNLKLSRASIVQFWASRYIMCPNRTSVWKVMTI